MKTFNITIENKPAGLYLNGNLCKIKTSGRIVTIENNSVGIGHSAHPNIDITGSVTGMKKLGYWAKDDVIVKSKGYYYNISKVSISDPIDALCLWLQGGKKLPSFEGTFSFSL
jgi:hypothetical protein